MAEALEHRVKVLRGKIETAKLTKAKAEGSKDEIKKSLKEESNIVNSKQGLAKIKKLDSEIVELTEDIEEVLTELEGEENAE